MIALLAAAAPLAAIDARDDGHPVPTALVALVDSVQAGQTEVAASALVEAAGGPGPLLRCLAACRPGAEVVYPFGSEWGREASRAIFAALAEAPHTELFLAARSGVGLGPFDALASLEVLSAFGTPEQFSDVAYAASALEEQADERLTARAIGSAVASLLQRGTTEEPAWPGLIRSWSSLPDRAREAAVAGIGSVDSTLAFRVSSELLPFENNCLPSVLSVLQVSSVGASFEARGAVAPTVRELLSREDPVILAAACRTISALGDEDSVPLLLELLEHDDRTVRSTSHRALKAISGRAFPAELEPWLRWYESELDWWAHSDAIRLDITRGSRAEAVAGLRQIAVRTTRPEERAHLAALAFEHRDAAVRRFACTVLAVIPSRAATEELFATLDGDGDVSVQEAARAALESRGVEGLG